MFTPTHFVQTDEVGAKNNHVANGQLVEELNRVTSVLGGSTLVDLETDAGESRSVFDHRLQPFDVSKHEVTCKYLDTPHHFTGDCPDARIVEPEPELELVDGRPALLEFIAAVRQTLDATADNVSKVERALRKDLEERPA